MSPKIDLKALSVDEIVNNITTMQTSLSHVKAHGIPGSYERVKHYVGMNHQQHIEELKARRYNVLANYYAKEWDKI